MYEQASERWSPVQSVEKVILSVISMLAGEWWASAVERRTNQSSEPNLESGANIDCCKLYRENRAVRMHHSAVSPELTTLRQEYERLVKESIKEQLGL